MLEKHFHIKHHRQITMHDHPNCDKRGKILEHRLEVELAIGRYLTPKEQVHHHYNANGTVILVLCPNQLCHKLLHTREAALRHCGNANWRKCVYCKKYDNLNNMTISTQHIYHKSCAAKYKQIGVL